MRQLLLLTALLLISLPALAQKSLTTLDVANVDSFTGFEGRGFGSTPEATQVDSDEYAVDGLNESPTETYCLFGGNCPADPASTTDYSRGISEGNAQLTGGVYAFDHITGVGVDVGIGWQAKGGSTPVFEPGDLIVKYRNDTNTAVDQFDVSYEFWYLNSDAGSHIVTFSWAAGACSDTLAEGTYTSVPALDFTTPATEDPSPIWAMEPQSTTVFPSPVADGDCFYLRFTGDSAGGGANQDEASVDDISVTPRVKPLAVELTSFEVLVAHRDVMLSWLTASSSGGDFEVQERTLREGVGNASWSTIARVQGGPAGAYSHRINEVAPGRHAYRLKMFDVDGSVSYSEQTEVVIDLQAAVNVTPVYPSPVSSSGTFSVAVAEDQSVSVEVFDILGRRVAQLHDGMMTAQIEYRVAVDGESLTNGLYIIRVAGDTFLTTRSMVVSR